MFCAPCNLVRPEYTPAQQNGHADTADGGSCFDRICPNLGATDVESSDVESSLITTGCFLLNTEVPFRLGCYYICSIWFCQCRYSVFYFLGGSGADGI